MDQNELPEILMDFSQIPSDLLWALNDLPMNQNKLPGVLDSRALEKTDIFQNESAYIKTCSGYHMKVPCLIAEPWDKAKNRRDTTVSQGKSVILLIICILTNMSKRTS